MRLQKVRIQNFRAIVDSGVVELDDRVTVLIGKNEQGKTTFLKGINSSDPRSKYAPSDLPNHLRAELEQRKPVELPIITLWLTPEPADDAVLAKTSLANKDIKYLRITKYYDNHRTMIAEDAGGADIPVTFAVPSFKDESARFGGILIALKEKLTAHGARSTEFQPHLPQAIAQIDQLASTAFDSNERIDNLVQTLGAALTSLPGQDEPIRDDIARAIKEADAVRIDAHKRAAQNPQIELDNLIPAFVLHSTTLDMIPNEVMIRDFINDPDKVSRGMANLCRVAGLSVQKIQELANAP